MSAEAKVYRYPADVLHGVVSGKGLVWRNVSLLVSGRWHAVCLKGNENNPKTGGFIFLARPLTMISNVLKLFFTILMNAGIGLFI